MLDKCSAWFDGATAFIRAEPIEPSLWCEFSFQRERNRRAWVGEFWLPPGPRLCGAPSELAITHSLSVPLILMHLAEALRFVSAGKDLPHTANTRAHTPGRRKESHRLNSTHGGYWHGTPSGDYWSPGHWVISIHALFHPQPVLLSLAPEVNHLTVSAAADSLFFSSSHGTVHQ